MHDISYVICCVRIIIRKSHLMKYVLCLCYCNVELYHFDGYSKNSDIYMLVDVLIVFMFIVWVISYFT